MNRSFSNNSLTLNEGVEHHIHHAQEEPSASDQVAGHDEEVPTTLVQSQTIQELEERIAFLEKELIETRLQLANARDSEECLKLEVSKLSRSNKANCSSSYPSSEEDWLLPAGDENRYVVVSTDDPFSRNSSSSNKKNASSDKKQVHKARRTSTKTSLNPGSCSSGLNLLAMASLPPSMPSNVSMSSLLGLQRPPRGGGGSRRNLLNPNSCSSGLNLLLNPNSCASGLNLLMGPPGHDLLRSNRNGSSGSGLSLSGLLGNARLLSSSSLNRRSGGGGSSRNNVSRLNRTSQASNGNRNEEWGVFE